MKLSSVPFALCAIVASFSAYAADPIKVAGIHPDIEIALGFDIRAKIEVVVKPPAATGRR